MCVVPSKMRYLFFINIGFSTKFYCLSIKYAVLIMIAFEKLFILGINLYIIDPQPFKKIIMVHLFFKLFYFVFLSVAILSSNFRIIYISWIIDSLITIIDFILGIFVFFIIQK